MLFHGIAWAVVFTGLWIYLPRQLQILADFQVKVPDWTLWILDLAQLIIDSFLIIPILLIPYFCLDWALYAWLRRNASSRKAFAIWFLLMLAVPLLFGLLIATDVSLAVHKLREELSK
jgi:hypothetical protein